MRSEGTGKANPSLSSCNSLDEKLAREVFRLAVQELSIGALRVRRGSDCGVHLQSVPAFTRLQQHGAYNVYDRFAAEPMTPVMVGDFNARLATGPIQLRSRLARLISTRSRSPYPTQLPLTDQCCCTIPAHA